MDDESITSRSGFFRARRSGEGNSEGLSCPREISMSRWRSEGKSTKPIIKLALRRKSLIV